MALRALISLTYLSKRLAGGVWPLEQTLNDANHIRGPTAQAFVLISKLRPVKIRRNRDRFAHRVGDQRKTPAGTLLPGVHRDTRWRHSRRYKTGDQWFAGKVVDLIDRIEPHKEFLKSLSSSGGQICVIVQFLGDGYFGDEVPKGILSRLADLDLNLGVECFTVPQGAGEMRNIQVIAAPKTALSVFSRPHARNLPFYFRSLSRTSSTLRIWPSYHSRMR